MNMTSRAFFPAKFFSVTVCPATTFGKRKSGAGVPNPSIVDSVRAITIYLCSMMIRPPILYRLLDVRRGQVGLGGPPRQLDKFLVRREAQRNDLRHGHARIH